MTEHWPADGSGDEFDGGYDPTAYRGIDAAGGAVLAGPTFVATLKATDQALITAARALDKAWHTPRDEATGGWANEWEFRMALDALHEACAAPREPGPHAHVYSRVKGTDDWSPCDICGRTIPNPPSAVSDPTYHPGDYESPHTAPFVQVRVNGELVPGHIVYPWPDGGLVVEPLEVAG